MKVKIFYIDDKDIEVTISPKDSKKFFDSIGTNQFYFDERKGKGFWTDIEKVRYMVVEDYTVDESNPKYYTSGGSDNEARSTDRKTKDEKISQRSNDEKLHGFDRSRECENLSRQINE